MSKKKKDLKRVTKKQLNSAIGAATGIMFYDKKKKKVMVPDFITILNLKQKKTKKIR